MRLLASAVVLGALLDAPAAWPCEPPRPDTVRLNPFTSQGEARLKDQDVPTLPRNPDFTFDVLHPAELAPASLWLERDGAKARQPLEAERGGEGLRFRLHPAADLAAGARYTVWGRLAGRAVRLLQLRSGAARDTAPPTLAQVTEARSLGPFTPTLGSCDGGDARVLLSLGAVSDDQSGAGELRYLIEGLAQPVTLSAWCGRLELRLGKAPPPAALRVTPVDLAGNRGAAVTVPLPKQEPGSQEAAGLLRSCAPGWPR